MPVRRREVHEREWREPVGADVPSTEPEAPQHDSRPHLETRNPQRPVSALLEPQVAHSHSPPTGCVVHMCVEDVVYKHQLMGSQGDRFLRSPGPFSDAQ
jgi:hypothetical protein